jgi:hypothetical protein
MAKRIWITGVLLLGAGLLAVQPGGLLAAKADKAEKAPKAPKVDEATQQQTQIGSDIITSAQLADFGRKQQSPAALISAAELLLRADTLTRGKLETITEQPTNDKKEPVKAEAEKPRSLKDEANDLLDEASALGANVPGVEGLIKAAKQRDYRDEASKAGNTRGTITGPRTIQRTINPGGTHHYNFHYVRQQPAFFGLKSTGRAPLWVGMTVGDFVRFDQTTTFGQVTFYPPRNIDQRTEQNHVRIQNVGKQPTTYTLFVN